MSMDDFQETPELEDLQIEAQSKLSLIAIYLFVIKVKKVFWEHFHV